MRGWGLKKEEEENKKTKNKKQANIEKTKQKKKRVCTAYRKGIRLIFLNQNADSSNAVTLNELEDAGRSPGKSSLFFLTS